MTKNSNDEIGDSDEKTKMALLPMPGLRWRNKRANERVVFESESMG